MLSTIQANTKDQSSKIIADAKAEAQKILEEGKQKADSIAEQGRARAEKQVQENKLRAIASARLEAKRKLLQARDEVLRSLEQQAVQYLEEFTKSPQYNELLSRQIKDGIAKIGAGAIVQVNARDRKVAQGVLPPDATLSPKALNSLGGALIVSKDEKRRVDSTLESLFRERNEEFKLKLSQSL